MSVVRQEQLGWELCRCRCVQCHYLLGWLEACWLLSPSYHPALMSTEVGDKIKPKISSMEYKTSHDTTPYDKTSFSRVWSIKIAILFFGTSSKSYILWCSWGYCAVPTFLRVFPVSAPCLSSSFKSIYCSQKSIRLSEERCRFSGYGSVLPHFLLVSYASPPKEKKKDWPHWKVWVCASFFFFWWWWEGRGVTHLWKRMSASWTFSPWQPNQWSRSFTSSARHTKSIFMLDQITSLPVTTVHSDKPLSTPTLTLDIELKISSAFHKALSHVDSKSMSPSIPFLPYISYPLLPSPFQFLRLPPFHCSLSPP